MKKILLFLFVYGALTIEIRGQEIVWTKKISDSLLSIKEMKMDSSGNFYLLGNLGSNSNSIPFVAKLDSLTNLLWTKTFQTTYHYNVQCNAIEIDKVGKIYIVGSFSDTMIIDSNYIFHGLGTSNGFIAKFDDSGSFISSQIFGTKGWNTIQDITFDSTNAFYITGSFKDTLCIDTTIYVSAIPATYLGKYSNNNLEWLKYSKAQYGCCNQTSGKHIGVNNQGDIFLHIIGYGNVYFDSIDFYMACQEDAEAVAIFDSSGNIKFINQLFCTYYIADVISDSNSFITAGGDGYSGSGSNPSAMANRYYANGSQVLIHNFGYSGGNSIAVDYKGNNFFIGGYHYPYEDQEEYNLFINKQGIPPWQMFIRASGGATGVSIIYNDSSLYALGRFSQLLLTPDSLFSQSSSYFIAKIKDNILITNNCVPPPPPIGENTTICINKTASLSATGTGILGWYSQAIDGTYLGEGANYTTPILTSNTTYYVQDSTCAASATRKSVLVTVNPLPDVTTNLSGLTISANQNGATYQWLNCNNANSPIIGATNQSYEVPTNGEYAVIITLNGCIDTSTCVNLNTTGIEKLVTNNNQLKIFPNPSKGLLTIQSISEGVYSIKTESGQTIQSFKLNSSNNYTINIENLSNGIYFIVGFNNNKNTNQKVIISK